MFPFRRDGNHWVLLVVNVPKIPATQGSIQYIDTLHCNPEKCTILSKTLSGTVQRTINIPEKVQDFIRNVDPTRNINWTTYVNQCSTQPDMSSCGFLACEMAKYTLMKWPIQRCGMSDVDVQIIRNRIVYEMLTNNLYF